MSRKLNARQTAFINEYLKDFNGTQAAIRAGYSKRTAQEISSENLSKPIISDEIKAKIEEKSMGADEVLTRLADMARGDIADLLDITTAGYSFKLLIRDNKGNLVTNPNTKLIKKIKQKVTTSLAKSEDGEDREIIETEIELYSAQEALIQIGKHHKLFTDKLEFSGKDGGPILIKVVYDNDNQ